MGSRTQVEGLALEGKGITLICVVPPLSQNFPVNGKVGVRFLGVVMTHLFHTHMNA